VQAANRGDSSAQIALAELQVEAGDRAGAEAILVQAANRGNEYALACLADLLKQTNDDDKARRVRQFGLDDDGLAAMAL
jgi:thioredoxin-like negative regulator of GroEL